MSFSSSPMLRNLVTDTWVKASWEEFLELEDHPDYADARFYYDRGYMRIEMAALGFRHGRQNSIVANLIVLFATIRNLEIIELTNTSFRKTGLREFQPDSSFYIGSGLRVPPESNSSVDLDEYDPPTLVLEIATTTLSDDLGPKRLLYERAGVQEYWVNDANSGRVIGFSISEGRSGEIRESLVLPGLRLSLVEQALERRQTQDDGEINRWLIQTFSQS
ncbi:Uma2 family endonuclease [Argonema antarcticum]|uniref:Uma2 family endonuclease n=1 Tax=Argonema antarcticum TaxID=2942763 RepID=UPI002011CED8|nr:Uma2 family endonuclease [Argonema antarcticum]MCL1471145.1 Uma2 family endonuclease [Argonema antarcticum A004/B2]